MPEYMQALVTMSLACLTYLHTKHDTSLAGR